MAWLKKVAFRARHSPLRARVRLLAALPRPVLSGAPRTGSIAKVIADSAFARVPPDERDWAERIEARRRELVSRQGQTEPVYGAVPPHGAGPLAAIYEPVRVGLATWLMSLPEVWCVVLMRMVRELAPRSCLELGTGLGISGAYQAAALELNGRGALTTLEGRREWAATAEDGFSGLGLERVAVLTGPIEYTIDDAARRAGPFDYAFVDAEHTEDATKALPRRHPAPHDRARGGRVRRCRREPGDQARLGLYQAPSPGCVRVRSRADGSRGRRVGPAPRAASVAWRPSVASSRRSATQARRNASRFSAALRAAFSSIWKPGSR